MTSPHVENDPLTASSWPADASDSVLDPHTTEIPLVEESDQMRRAVPKPPDVDEILRGDYTGWVPVIKAGESQVDAEERARARIRRIEAELDAEEDTGDARSVSMWMTESMAVKLPPVQQPVVTEQVVIPSAAVRPATPDTVRAIHDILDPPWESPRGDDDKVLSPGEALDEARRRIRQMRVDLENNVEMVTRSFEHSVFQVPAGAGLPAQRLFDDPVLPDDDTDYPEVVKRSPMPVVSREPVQPRDEVRPHQPEEPSPGVAPAASVTAVVEPTPHMVEPGVDMDAIADAIEAALDDDGAASDEELRAALATFTRRTDIESDDAAAAGDDHGDMATEALHDVDEADNVSIHSSVETVSVEPEPDGAAAADVLAQSAAQSDLAAATTGLADLRDSLTGAPAAAPAETPPAAPGLFDDSEARFLSDLLSTLDEVEATVTQLANTTALDDVLAKYADILESDTSHVVTPAEIEEAREVQQRAAEARTDLDAMLRTLKAAAGTFTDEPSGQGLAGAAAVLEGMLTGAEAAEPAGREPATATAHASLAGPAAPAPAPGPEPSAAAQVVSAPEPAATRIVNQVVLEPSNIEVPPSPGAADEPDLVRRVASALRPIDLPAAFRGEPKRMTAQEQEEILRRHPQQEPAPFVREPGGKRADTPEESEIDKIIEAAADRGSEDKARSFWDDEDADVAAPEPATAPAPEHRDQHRSESRDADTLFATSQPATTYLLSEQAPQDHSLELVIMRDEIRDLRDRLDSSQKLVEDLMLRLANLTEIALQHRSN